MGDPTEGSLLTLGKKASLDKKKLDEEYPILYEIPFSPERRRMSVVRQIDDKRILFVKGSCEGILPRCTSILLQEKQEPLTPETITEANASLGRKGLRNLALAYRDVTNEPLDENLEQNLVFIGFVALMDPPRPEVPHAIKTAQRAGVSVVMITGDYKETAQAIAQEIGIMGKHSIAINGYELDRMDDKELKQHIRTISVYARVSPEHKLRIVDAWKSIGEVVAMTGDGVNDAPAIKAADIGIAMGLTGTDVAKEASDMILLDDNFASIVKAIKEGRGIYDNITKFIYYLLSSNIAELLVIFTGTFLGFKDLQGNPFISLIPVQLLWINLLTDGLPALALCLDPTDPQIMLHHPRKAQEKIITWPATLELFLIGAIIACGTIAACHFGLTKSAQLAHTMALTTLVTLEFVRIQQVRTAYHLSFFSNTWLIIALIFSFIAQLMVIYVKPLQVIFKTTPLGLTEWAIIFLVTFIVWLTLFGYRKLSAYSIKSS